MRLDDAHANVLSSEDADRVVSEWFDNLPEGSERMNIHAWRSALLSDLFLSWNALHRFQRRQGSSSGVLRTEVCSQYGVSSHEIYAL